MEIETQTIQAVRGIGQIALEENDKLQIGKNNNIIKEFVVPAGKKITVVVQVTGELIDK